MALSVLISNTDDHLRNHGFLHVDRDRWDLSPAFDINPNPEPGTGEHATAIGLDDPAATVDNLLGVVEYFRLAPTEAGVILGEVAAATSRWRTTAARNGLTARAIEGMAPAFEHDEAMRARRMPRRP